VRSQGAGISVVLPCLDEERSVGLCVQEALNALAESGLRGEVVVVDNGSTDNSVATATAAGARVVEERRPGYGSALLTGFEAAAFDTLVMADADFTYDLGRIPELVAPIMDGAADLVVGSRLDAANRRTMPILHRLIGTPLLTFLTARACGRRVVTDSQSGYRALRRDSLSVMNLSASGMELASEMLISSARANLRIQEIETGYRPRIGQSKLSAWSDGWRHLLLIFMLAPDLLLIGPGLILLVLGLSMLGLSFAHPRGVEIGSLVWQPVFFSGIALVLGMQGLLAGAILAHNSSLTPTGIGHRFSFVGKPNFPNRCIGTGIGIALLGLLLNLVLFLLWLGDRVRTPSSHFGLASLSESLIIIGSTVATFGIVTRFTRARTARVTADVIRSPSDKLGRSSEISLPQKR